MEHNEALKLLEWYENQDHRSLARIEEKSGLWYVYDLFTKKLIFYESI